MSRNIILVTWPDSAKAYQEYSELKRANISGIQQAVIIERKEDGKLAINEGDSNTIGIKSLGGGLIGMLVGVIAGPLGMLLGFTTGALFGSIFDIKDISEDSTILSKLSQSFKLGTTGLLLDIEEEDTTAVDAYFAAKNATLQRWSYDEVKAEVEASISAWEQVNATAEQAIKEQKKAEHAEKRKEKWAEFKEKLHLKNL